ncbi:HesB/IscA family protein [Paracraurococcus lichenis]|uniref:Iron-sulfur cluster assembly accessory protein n=1 Tax=Paracraurococcus lichenis TaxID=3064888 RepID=A0ABT9E161_9PROT|nr:iron-sulfur cluster assembly accessory protein [Paracraurococcus sp. LOR1-02]MDO9709878.1 iron-sulfur cluster assembly accessory protein [Paracraurococcus sp. LOR1-02]
MIELTDSAVRAVRQALGTSQAPDTGLRIMVEAGGCSGFKYAMGIVQQPEATDVVIEKDGVRVYVDAVSEEYLKGTVVDFVTALEGSGFSFDNPNAASKCSCGKSFG